MRCEDCQHFGAPSWSGDSFGYCNIRLPPWVGRDPDEDRVVHKADQCDLHKPKDQPDEKEST